MRIKPFIPHLSLKLKTNIPGALLCIFCLATLSLFSPAQAAVSQLDKIKARGFLHVGLQNSNRSYYIDTNGPNGLDYVLAKRFAQYLGVKLVIQSSYTVQGLLPALDHGEIDLIASGVINSTHKSDKYHVGPSYYTTTQQLVYQNHHWFPRQFSDLVKKGQKIHVIANSPYIKTLEKLQKKYPKLSWHTSKGQSIEGLLIRVAQGEIPFTIADSIDVALIQQTHPELAVALDITDEQDVSWLVKKERNESLYATLIEFFGEQNQSGALAQLKNKYFAHLKSFDYVETRTFIRALDTELAQWKPLFQRYADGFDWRLIAAMAYQESHWNPHATSPTGVRGMMMLTNSTAKRVDVTNRLDPEQSIKGGVKYLQSMLQRIPQRIRPEEKIWFALGSYNLGLGHILDARALVRQQGKDDNIWLNVEKVLPLLMQPKYYKKSTYGYARGTETLAYIQNIRRYYHSIVEWDNQQRLKIKSKTQTNDSDVDHLQKIDVNLASHTETSLGKEVSFTSQKTETSNNEIKESSTSKSKQ